jgi:hypothetical protein
VDRLERLVNLVAALLDSERPLTREELRTRVGGYAADDEAFRRNFERDKDALRRMGMPVVAEPLERDPGEEQVGYRVPRDRYELEKSSRPCGSRPRPFASTDPARTRSGATPFASWPRPAAAGLDSSARRSRRASAAGWPSWRAVRW